MDIEDKNLVVWQDKFAIGIPLIDGEHKKLITMCNNLYKVIVSGNYVTTEQRREAMKIALKECADYSKSHFKHEESLMELCGFDSDKFLEHKHEHKSFALETFTEIANFEKENHVSSYEFVKFLYDWILTHIAYSDRLYVDTLMDFLKRNPDVLKKQ